MAYNKQSIINKIAGKGVITAYEAIYLQYLNKLHIKEQTPDVERWRNSYIAAEEISELYSQYDLRRLLTFQTTEEGSLYDAYRWAANSMIKFDAHTGELGYKALALLNELKYFRSEYIMLITRNLKDEIAIEGTLFEFSAYSQVHQQNMTFTHLVESFTDAFYLLIISIDNILTLNYYLQTMTPPEELNCLTLLKQLLAEEKVAEDEGEINISRACYGQIVKINLEINHGQFIEFMKRQISSFNRPIDPSLPEGSLQYVKKILADHSTKS